MAFNFLILYICAIIVVVKIFGGMYVMKKSKCISNRMDMLNGSIFDKILLFALPLAISSILQQLFNSVDVAVVGRFASSEALAAVGSNSSVISLLINLFVGISVGANVVIANYIGQGKTEKIFETAAIRDENHVLYQECTLGYLYKHVNNLFGKDRASGIGYYSFYPRTGEYFTNK